MTAPIRLTSFVRELCEAVAHRWQPDRIFVVLTLTAYLDESGTHGDSPVTVMGGIMATASQWDRFEAEFDRIRAHYGFRVFHTKNFVGWHPLRQLALMHDLAVLTSAEGAFIDSVTVTLDNADYKANYISGEKPRRLRLESKYGLCFRNCLFYFILEGMKWIHEGAPPKMHFVLESGHRNAYEAIWRQIAAQPETLDRSNLQRRATISRRSSSRLCHYRNVARTAILPAVNALGTSCERRKLKKPEPQDLGQGSGALDLLTPTGMRKPVRCRAARSRPRLNGLIAMVAEFSLAR